MTSPNVSELERDVEARSGVLKKELGLFDLVLSQVVFVVGTFWVGWAARLGNEQNVFWILAIVTFYLPLAAAVIFHPAINFLAMLIQNGVALVLPGWVRIGPDGKVARCHLRDPSWFQWPLLEAVIEGNIVADFPLCNKSFNCSYSGHDI